MRSIIYIGLCAYLALTYACKKDDVITNCMRLEGIWHSHSWKEDGEELHGDTAYIISSTLNLKTLTNSAGDYEWTTSYTIGGDNTVIGSYSVNSDCTQVNITPKGGGPADVYNFQFKGDTLVLDGTVNSIVRVLKFSK